MYSPSPTATFSLSPPPFFSVHICMQPVHVARFSCAFSLAPKSKYKVTRWQQQQQQQHLHQQQQQQQQHVPQAQQQQQTEAAPRCIFLGDLNF